jgi:hypothetical protein
VGTSRRNAELGVARGPGGRFWNSYVADLQLASTISGVPAERVRLRIGNLAKAVLVSGQAYQDPKDALNEFVSNAADEYVEAGKRGQRIRVLLRRKGRPVPGYSGGRFWSRHEFGSAARGRAQPLRILQGRR